MDAALSEEQSGFSRWANLHNELQMKKLCEVYSHLNRKEFEYQKDPTDFFRRLVTVDETCIKAKDFS